MTVSRVTNCAMTLRLVTDRPVADPNLLLTRITGTRDRCKCVFRPRVFRPPVVRPHVARPTGENRVIAPASRRAVRSIRGHDYGNPAARSA